MARLVLAAAPTTIALAPAPGSGSHRAAPTTIVHSSDSELPDPLRRDAAAIVAAFQRARADHAFEDPSLRAAVETFARTAHELEMPPERLLVALRRVVHGQALTGVNAWFRTVMSERAAAWAIDAYFGGAHDATGERTPE
jgi:hypothetical protein